MAWGVSGRLTVEKSKANTVELRNGACNLQTVTCWKSFSTPLKLNGCGGSDSGKSCRNDGGHSELHFDFIGEGSSNGYV